MASPGQANVKSCAPQLVVLGLITFSALAIYLIESPSDVATALGRAGIPIGRGPGGDVQRVPAVDVGIPTVPQKPPSSAPPAAAKAAPVAKAAPNDAPVPAAPTKPLSAAYADARTLIDAARSTPTDPVPPALTSVLADMGMRNIQAYINASRDVPHSSAEIPWRSAKMSKVLAGRQFGREKWWRTLSNTGQWRSGTMEAFKVALKDRPGTVIDCGAWIGATTLAAVNLKAARVYALEVNPVVFVHLAYNIALNPNAAAIATAFLMGASNASAVREFSLAACSNDIGDKCSSMVAKPKHPERWRVQTLPLDQFIDAEGIRHEDLSVIKLSTAGGEVDILPPLVPWLAAWTGRKPTIVLELSGALMAPVRPDWVATVTPFLRLFKYGYLLTSISQEMGDWTLQWQGAGASTAAPDPHCVPNSCDYVLSDVPLDGLHITKRP